MCRSDDKPLDSKKVKHKSICFVRYADDFVVMHHDLKVIQKCKEMISKFLAKRNLELSNTKTKIVHTRKHFENNESGFEFLGFKIKQFDTKKHSAKDNRGRDIGFRLLTFPSKNSRKKHFATVDRILRQFKTSNQSQIIKQLNPIIISWTNYFRFSHFTTTKIEGYMEQILFNKLIYWGRRKLNSSKKSKKSYDKFWHTIKGRKQFAYKSRDGEYIAISLYRKVAKGISLTKYIKIKKDVSVYNGDVRYWSRRAINPKSKTMTKNKLLKKQNYKCTRCGKIFMPLDSIETDHIVSKAKGGSDKISNLQLLHAVCHDKKGIK